MPCENRPARSPSAHENSPSPHRRAPKRPPRSHLRPGVLFLGLLGCALLPTLGDDVDIRSDVPRYRVWRRGELEVQNFYGLKARQCDCNSAVKAHFDEVLAGTYPV
mgnify:CR=1 FL=1